MGTGAPVETPQSLAALVTRMHDLVDYCDNMGGYPSKVLKIPLSATAVFKLAFLLAHLF